jgi:hypothetical protein
MHVGLPWAGIRLLLEVCKFVDYFSYRSLKISRLLSKLP